MLLWASTTIVEGTCWFSASLAISEALDGRRRRGVVDALLALARVHDYQLRHAEAEEALSEALEITRGLGRPEDEVLEIETELAGTLMLQATAVGNAAHVGKEKVR